MGDAPPITEARAQFGSLVRRTSHARERITITDHGRPAAALIHPRELAGLEDTLALAGYRERQGSGPRQPCPTMTSAPGSDWSPGDLLVVIHVGRLG